jgi:hypothetical protein
MTKRKRSDDENSNSNNGTPTTTRKRTKTSDRHHKLIIKKTSNWLSVGLFTIPHFVACMFDYKSYCTDFLSVVIITKKMIDNLTNEKCGDLSVQDLWNDISVYADRNQWMRTESNVVDWFSQVFFQFNVNRTRIKCPVCFYSNNSNQIVTELNSILSEILHLTLNKIYIENRELFKMCKQYQKKEFAKFEPSLKDNILNNLYNEIKLRCQESHEENGIKYFRPSPSIIEGVIDGTHAVIYLGYCFREDPNDQLIMKGLLPKKYAVVTAYFCSEPVIVDFDRMDFEFRCIHKCAENGFAVVWANSEITFEVGMEQQYQEFKQQIGDIDIPQYDPHPLEDYCNV